jgi:hypothetical protein
MTEAPGDTVSADLSPDEKELQTKFKSPSSPVSRDRGVDGHKFQQDSPAKVKAKQVAKILQSKGMTQDAENMRKIKQDLLPSLEKMDPQELFAADPEEVATQFASKFLKN